MKCKHRRCKEIKTHGEKSKGYLVCKRCDKVVDRHTIKKNKNERQRRKRNNYR